MICYRDMTFCPFYKECANGDVCERSLTDEVMDAAERWMKNAPISQYAEKPRCFEQKEDQDD